MPIREARCGLRLGVDVQRCPFCGRPMSYRDGSPFCRCRLGLKRKPYGKKGKDRLKR